MWEGGIWSGASELGGMIAQEGQSKEGFICQTSTDHRNTEPKALTVISLSSPEAFAVMRHSIYIFLFERTKPTNQTNTTTRYFTQIVPRGRGAKKRLLHWAHDSWSHWHGWVT